MERDECQHGAGYTDEYQDGRTAYRKGVSIDENPYPRSGGNGYRRKHWFEGWLDELYQDLHSKLDALLIELKRKPRPRC